RFSIHASSTSVGAGRRKRGTFKVRQISCQTATTTMKTRIGGAAALIDLTSGDGSRRGTTARSVVDVDLGSTVVASSVLLARLGRAAEQRDDLADDPREFRSGPNLGNARVWQRDRHLG